MFSHCPKKVAHKSYGTYLFQFFRPKLNLTMMSLEAYKKTWLILTIVLTNSW